MTPCYERFFEDSPDLLCVAERDGTFLALNQAWERVLGWTRAELVGRRGHEFCHPDDMARTREAAARLAEGAPVTVLNRYRHKDGGWRWLSWRFTEGDGVFHATARDVTEELATEAAVRERDEVIRGFYDASAMLMGVVEERGGDFFLLSCNEPTAASLGSTPAAVAGKSWSDVGLPRDYAEFLIAQFRLAKRRGAPVTVEHRAAGLGSPKPRWSSTTMTWLGPSRCGTDRFAFVSYDVTERRQAEERLREQELKLIALSKLSALGEMAGGIAHEINNPLTIIQGKASQLTRELRHGRPDGARAAEALQTIEAMVQRITAIVRGMRSLSRDGGAQPLQEVTVSELIQDAVNLCTERFRAPRIDLVRAVPDGLAVECRAVQVSQILLNLLNNAFAAHETAAHRAGPLWVRIEAADAGERVRIAVTDNGPGVPAALAERIFEPFFTTKDESRGTGLGLSISRALAAQNGGTLRLEPPGAGGGARFVVELPKHLDNRL